MAEPDPEQEALRLKTLAESDFKSSDLKSAIKHAKAAHRLFPTLPGLSEMITCFKILAGASTASVSGTPDYYGILQVEPFSHINSIRKQYKSLALATHPDKNASLGSSEAFKVVGDAFRVLSDRIRRKEYDMKLRIRLQEEAAGGDGLVNEVAMERFWTACSQCKILHQFEKKYLGHNLVCPSCGKSFRAVEIGDNDEDQGEDEEEASEHEAGNSKLKRKAVPVAESYAGRLRKRESRSEVRRFRNEAVSEEEEEMMTLAEMKLEATSKMSRERIVLREKDKEKKQSASEKIGAYDSVKMELVKVYRRGAWRRKSSVSKGIEEFVLIEDSDFYDFNKNRSERRFKKGQIWAAYDKVEGMPRNYLLIEEVYPSPFTLRVSLLDLLQKRNLRVNDSSNLACGRFKVSQKTTLKSAKLLSHEVICERAARELYMVYPKKGSTWAVFNKSKCSYDIVVFLTNYSEVYGASMANLVRVPGFKTVFRRQEIGPHAVRWLGKSELGLCSHQIPSRKLEGDEVPEIVKGCWELDHASLPPDMLTIPMREVDVWRDE